MPLSNYEELHKDKVEYEIQARYARDVEELRAIGFEEEFYLRESGYPFSALLRFDIWLGLYRGKEVFHIGEWLRFVIFNAYLIHEDGYAYAVPFHLGIKYATAFEDGTLLITSNYQNGVQSQPKYNYIRQVCDQNPKNAKDSWHMHQEGVRKLAKGMNVISPLRVSDIIRMEMRSDKILTGGIPNDWDAESTEKRKI